MSIYKVLDIIGTSPDSFEDAARTAVETASESINHLRIAEVTKLDMTIENGKVKSYRARVNLSFKMDR